MIDLVRAASTFQQELDARDLPNVVIGGLALLAWGEPRVTRDIDLTVLTRFVDEEAKVRTILELVTPRVSDALAFALANRVILGHLDGQVPVDVGIGGFPFEELVVQRAVGMEFAPSIRLRICTAEDLVVMKVFAGRERDWLDVIGVLARQPDLEWEQIETDLVPLLELSGFPERWMRIQALKAAI
jgi:hypothetical protein